MRVPNPPAPFPPFAKPYQLKSGTIITRIFNGAFPLDSFNPCAGRPSRFAPIWLDQPAGQRCCVPTLYAATNFECAVYETVFHDISPKARYRIVPASDIALLRCGEIQIQSELHLAPLFQPELGALEITRANLIDTPKRWYAQTVRWAAAIHEAFLDLHGLAWTSRPCDPEIAFLLFGDRIDSNDLLPLSHASLAEDLYDALVRAGERSRITILS